MLAGPLVTCAGAITYFTTFVHVPGLRDVPWLNLPLAWLGVAFAATGARRSWRTLPGKAAGIVSLALALLLATLFTLFVFVLSYGLPPPTAIVVPGAAAPDFALPDASGTPVTLSSLRGRKVLLVFFRGHW